MFEGKKNTWPPEKIPAPDLNSVASPISLDLCSLALFNRKIENMAIADLANWAKISKRPQNLFFYVFRAKIRLFKGRALILGGHKNQNLPTSPLHK